MRGPACALLIVLSACATPVRPPARAPVPQDSTVTHLPLSNLRRALALPWKDEGRCVAAAANNPWRVVAERCFHELDREKVRFQDVKHRCPVASVDAAEMQAMVGFCLLVQPELVVGAVVVVSAFVVAVAIVQAIDAYELNQREEAARKRQVRPPVLNPSPERAPDPSPEPEPSPLGPDFIPLSPDSTERRPECKPKPVPHRGGNNKSNTCADKVPGNAFPGWDVLVNGKQFDALQSAERMLWEVKLYNFDDYPPAFQEFLIKEKVEELRDERDIAKACGYDFTVGVTSAAHQKALLEASRFSLKVVLMDWCSQ